MKNTSLVLLSLAVAGTASARDLFSPEEHRVTPVEICLATPVQLPDKTWSVHGLRWNFIYGASYDVYGLDFGLVGYNRNDIYGLQLQAAADWADGDMGGAQLAGIANVVTANATGLQLSGIVNYTRGEFTGAQFAPINYNGAFYGFQTGLFNYDKGISWGLQLGFANATVNEFNGWSIGVVNCAVRMSGLQLGVVNIAAETGRGLQLGLFNSAAKYSGVQIGILNIIDNGELPIMPVLNAQF